MSISPKKELLNASNAAWNNLRRFEISKTSVNNEGEISYHFNSEEDRTTHELLLEQYTQAIGAYRNFEGQSANKKPPTKKQSVATGQASGQEVSMQTDDETTTLQNFYENHQGKKLTLSLEVGGVKGKKTMTMKQFIESTQFQENSPLAKLINTVFNKLHQKS